MAKVDIIGEVPLPKVRFTKHAMKWVAAMIDNHSEEIGFYGVVERDGNIFTITDIFYPKHELVTSTTCEIDPEGMRNIMMYLMDNHRDADIGNLKMWGHSHVNMGISPSGQDETQAMTLVKDNGDYLIRLIANKKGEMGITLYDLESRLKYSDLPYVVIESEEEVAKKLLDISAILASDNDPATILNSIRFISKQNDLKDDAYKAIVDKITKLKEVNIPKKTYPSYNGGYGNFPRSVEQTTKKVESPVVASPTSQMNTSAFHREPVKAASTQKERSNDLPGYGIGSRDHPDLLAYYNDLYGID